LLEHGDKNCLGDGFGLISLFLTFAIGLGPLIVAAIDGLLPFYDFESRISVRKKLLS